MSSRGPIPEFSACPGIHRRVSSANSADCPFAGLRANPPETPGFDRTLMPVLL
jgi:hypothetical protein